MNKKEKFKHVGNVIEVERKIENFLLGESEIQLNEMFSFLLKR
jgi:hypothetical protein